MLRDVSVPKAMAAQDTVSDFRPRIDHALFGQGFLGGPARTAVRVVTQ
jgi:hypothetical protein